MRTENALDARATDTVGPLRIRLLGAVSAKQAVVVVDDRAGGGSADPDYHVFTVSEVMASFTGRASDTPLTEALALTGRAPATAVSLRTATDADVGRPVVENGRLLGVVAGEILRAESTEDEMGREMTPPAGAAPTGPVDEPPARRRWGFLRGRG